MASIVNTNSTDIRETGAKSMRFENKLSWHDYFLAQARANEDRAMHPLVYAFPVNAKKLSENHSTKPQ